MIKEIKFLDFDYMHRPIKELMLAKFEEFYDRSWYILGADVKNFELSYANFSNTKYCVGVANGLDALVLCLRALQIGRGDEVIVPSNTYIASWLAVSIVGATPVPVEPRIGTYNINPDLIAEKITPRTKAIMPVHLYGQPCEMSQILSVAKSNNLYVVEDNAQAQGAFFNKQITGSFGTVNATSFYPGKNFGALGDAGAITTDSEELASRIAMLRNYGSQNKYYNEEKGINSRLDEIQAGFLSIKLNHLEFWNNARKSIAKKYDERLREVEDIIIPQAAQGSSSVHHLYVIRSKKRDTLQEHLRKASVATMIHYPVPPHLQKAYQDLGFKKGDFPRSEEIANTCLSLPIYPGLSDDSIDYITNSIKSFFS